MREKSGWLIAALLVLVVGSGIYWMLTRRYGETSQRGYAYSVALFSACNQRNVEKLSQIAAMLARDIDNGDIGGREAGWLSAIIDQGQQGDWQSASRRIRQLMSDQVREVP